MIPISIENNYIAYTEDYYLGQIVSCKNQYIRSLKEVLRGGYSLKVKTQIHYRNVCRHGFQHTLLGIKRIFAKNGTLCTQYYSER